MLLRCQEPSKFKQVKHRFMKIINTFQSKKLLALGVIALLILPELTACSQVGREVAEGIAAGTAKEGAENIGTRVFQQGAARATTNSIMKIEGATWRRQTNGVIKVYMLVRRQQRVHEVVASCQQGIESSNIGEISSSEQSRLQEGVRSICNRISK